MMKARVCRAALVVLASLTFACTHSTPAHRLRGVDIHTKTLTVGALNDVSGPAAAIGTPFALGKRILVRDINAGGSGLLPPGWTVKLVERDHGYDPTKAVTLYNQLDETVLYLATCFGTPNTLPLVPLLQRDHMVAFPSGLASSLGDNLYTPPVGPSYASEAMRAMDWVMQHAAHTAAVKPAIIYEQDDFGTDALAGWKKAAAHYHLKLVSVQPIAPGQGDSTQLVKALQSAGATDVLLATLPSSTALILGAAAHAKYAPVWLGTQPSWLDKFFDAGVIPSVIFAHYYWVTGMPYWGEAVPGMKEFLAAFTHYGQAGSPPNFYTLLSYIQGRVGIEAFRRALVKGDVSPTGYLAALRSLRDYTVGGMVRPLDLSRLPYVSSTETRVLQPDFAKRSWKVVAGYATPKSWQPPVPAPAPHEASAGTTARAKPL